MSEQHAGEARPDRFRSSDYSNCYVQNEHGDYVPVAPQPQHAGEHSPEPWTPDWEAIRCAVKAAIEAEPVGFDVSPSGLMVAHARREYERQRSARAPALQAEVSRLRKELQAIDASAKEDFAIACAAGNYPSASALESVSKLAVAALRESGVGK